VLSTALGVGLAPQKDREKKDRDALPGYWVAKKGGYSTYVVELFSCCFFFGGGALEIPIVSCFFKFKVILFWGGSTEQFMYGFWFLR